MSGFWKWGFRANVSVHQGKTVALPVTESGSEKDQVEVSEVIKSLELPSKLWLNPLLFNGTLQTLYYTSHQSDLNVFYGRELFKYTDGGTCSLDWVIPPEPKQVFDELYAQNLPEGNPRLHPKTRFLSERELAEREAAMKLAQTPIVVVCHGLAGGSHEALIRYLAGAVDPEWDTVVLNNRGCGRTKVTSPQLFHAKSTDDIRQVLVDLHAKYSHRPIYIVGFSFGALILANYLGANYDDHLVKAACVIACPWDLVDSFHHMESSLSGRYLFNPALTSFLNTLVKNNAEGLNKHANDIFTPENIKKAKSAKNTAGFDQVFTCKTAGFETWGQYYRECSPALALPYIKIPTLCVNSTDDPLVGVRLPIAEAEANPYVTMVTTDLGGHLAWVQTGGKFWGAAVVKQFFEKFEETYRK